MPDDTKKLIMRLTNAEAESMHPETRVENEVAMISLAAAALKDFRPRVVPSVYAWGSAAAQDSQGWILQELMPGESLDELYPSMDIEDKKEVVAQMAKMLKAVQNYRLPESISQFGGVTFDENGQIVSAAMSTVGAGPWQSYEAYFKERIEIALEKAASNKAIDGWKSGKLGDRLRAFVENGLPAQFESLKTKQQKSIIHADFSKPSRFASPVIVKNHVLSCSCVRHFVTFYLRK